MKHYLGIDIGGTKILAALVNEHGDILAQQRLPTSQNGDNALIAQLVDIRAELERDSGVRARGIGIGMPAAIDPTSDHLHLMPNLPTLTGQGFIARLRQAFDIPVCVENDVNLAALGEAWRGQGGDPLVLIAIGTGIGMGIVANGCLYRGRHGAAGEIALLPIGAAQPPSEHYRRGLLESTLGGAAWLAAYHAQGGDSTRTLAECFAAPDTAFQQVLEKQSEQLALAILAVCAIVDPQTVCLGGSIGLQSALQTHTQTHLARYCERPPSIRPAALGHHAGVIGAARAAMFNDKKPA